MSNNTLSISIFIISIFLISLIFGVVIKDYQHDQEIEELKQLEQRIEFEEIYTIIFKDVLEEITEYNLLQQALNKIDKNDYSEDYNCYEFSKDLQQELSELDIFSVIAITKDRTHSFLLVGVEATEGRFLEVDNQYEIMEIRDNNLEVINL